MRDEKRRISHVVAASGVLTLNGLTLAGGEISDQTSNDRLKGSGIRNLGFVNLSHCSVRDHGLRSYPGGGGIVNQGGVIVINQCTIHRNAEGDGCGAGLFSQDGVVTIAQSSIHDNNAYDNSNGGGLCTEGGHLWLLQSTVQDNATDGAGGGIVNRGFMHIAESTVSDNRIVEFFAGGGIWNTGDLTAINSTVSRNQNRLTVSGGGGIFNAGRLSLRGSTVTQNQSVFESSDADVARGGGILSSGGTVTLEQTIVAGNTLQEEPFDAPPSTSPSDCAGSLTSHGYNLVGQGTGCPQDSVGDRTAAPDQIFTTVLGPLQLNGGLTETHAPLIGSPAIDAMPEDVCQLSRDQRGGPRPEDGDANGVFACDAGAVELRPGCEAQFGEAPGFVLCEETATTCRFNAFTDGGTCDDLCRNFGARCLGAFDNEGPSCTPFPESSDTCQTPRQTEICICER